MTKIMRRGVWVKKLFLQHICSIIAAYLQYIDWNEWSFSPPLYFGYFLTFYYENFAIWVFLSDRIILIGSFILMCQVCCSSLSTASWRHLEEVLLLDIFLFFIQIVRLGIDMLVTISLKVCWNSLSTAFLRQLGDALLLDAYMLFHPKQFCGRTWKVT